MPRNQFQRMFFAFVTVLITVHAYVFFSLYVINGDVLMEINHTNSVLDAIYNQGGVYMFGNYLPIWAVVITEFLLAFLIENLVGSPFSFKLASKAFDPSSTHPVIFETAIICATVGIMCPSMSLIASFLYYPYYNGFDIITLLANWLKLMCYNFPFAFFTQLFFIQPFVRKVFKLVFCRNMNEKKEITDKSKLQLDLE